MHIHIHSSSIHNSQKVEITHVSTDGWMDEKNVVYTYSRILFSCEKEENSSPCYNMDEPWRHYAKWNKPVTERQILYDSTYMQYLE